MKSLPFLCSAHGWWIHAGDEDEDGRPAVSSSAPCPCVIGGGQTVAANSSIFS